MTNYRDYFIAENDKKEKIMLSFGEVMKGRDRFLGKADYVKYYCEQFIIIEVLNEKKGNHMLNKEIIITQAIKNKGLKRLADKKERIKKHAKMLEDAKKYLNEKPDPFRNWAGRRCF